MPYGGARLQLYGTSITPTEREKNMPDHRQPPENGEARGPDMARMATTMKVDVLAAIDGAVGRIIQEARLYEAAYVQASDRAREASDECQDLEARLESQQDQYLEANRELASERDAALENVEELKRSVRTLETALATAVSERDQLQAHVTTLRTDGAAARVEVETLRERLRGGQGGKVHVGPWSMERIATALMRRVTRPYLDNRGHFSPDEMEAAGSLTLDIETAMDGGLVLTITEEPVELEDYLLTTPDPVIAQKGAVLDSAGGAEARERGRKAAAAALRDGTVRGRAGPEMMMNVFPRTKVAGEFVQTGVEEPDE